MKRKSFKKRIMSLGFSRNQAEGFSCLACALPESYAAAWSAICFGLEARAAEGAGGAGDREGRPYGEEVPSCE